MSCKCTYLVGSAFESLDKAEPTVSIQATDQIARVNDLSHFLLVLFFIAISI